MTPALSPSIGVDVVEFKKASRFYSQHRLTLDAHFSSNEIQFIRSGKRPVKRLAMLLAAKEACFKASSKKSSGFTAFKEVRVLRAGQLTKRVRCVMKPQYVVAYALASDR